MLVGDFNVEPTKIPCLAKGISAGLWVDFGEAWALAAGLQPAPTCKHSWTSGGGHRRDFILGCPLAAAALLSCKVQLDRWIAPHLAVRALFDYGRWESWVTQPVRCTPLWPASWLPVVDKTRDSKSVEVRGGFGKFMTSDFSLCLVGTPLCLMILLIRMMFLGLVCLVSGC